MDNKPTNPNDNRKNGNNNNRRNSLLPLIAITLALTVGIQYLSLYLGGANTRSATQEIMYSEFMDLVEDGKVEQVILQDGNLEITLKDGAT